MVAKQPARKDMFVVERGFGWVGGAEEAVVGFADQIPEALDAYELIFSICGND